MSNKSKLDYIQLAKELTRSDDIKVILAAAKEIEGYVADDDDGYALPDTAIEFMEQAEIWTIGGKRPLRLYEYQKGWVDWLEDDLQAPTKPFILISARQMGSSTVMPLYGLWEAMRKPWSRVLVIAPRFALATEHRERVVLAIESAGIPVTAINKTKITLENHSEIEFVTYSEIAKPGYRDVNVAIFMDAAYYPHGRASDIMMWTQRQLNLGAKIIVASSAGVAKGFLHSLVNELNYPFISTPWHDHPDRSPEWIEQQRMYLSPAQFASEMECQFIRWEEDENKSR